MEAIRMNELTKKYKGVTAVDRLESEYPQWRIIFVTWSKRGWKNHYDPNAVLSDQTGRRRRSAERKKYFDRYGTGQGANWSFPSGDSNCAESDN